MYDFIKVMWILNRIDNQEELKEICSNAGLNEEEYLSILKLEKMRIINFRRRR